MRAPGGSGLSRVADRIWVDWPVALSRVSLSLGVAARDGDYLRAWPAVGVGAPVAAGIVGVALGFLHPEPSFSSSLIALVLFAALAGAGGGLGLMAWAGYCLADLLSGAPLQYGLWKSGVPSALSYMLLFSLLVVIPIIAVGVRLQTVQQLRLRGAPAVWVGSATQGLLQGIGTGLWALAASFLLRPFWSFRGSAPPLAAIEPLQEQEWLLGLIAGALAAGRVVVAHSATPRMPAGSRPFVPAARRFQISHKFTIFAHALVLTLLVGGLIDGPPQAVLVFAILVVAFALQRIVLPTVAGYSAIVRRVPLLVRLAVLALVTYALSGLIVQPALDRGDSSFTSMAVSFALSFLLAACLFPSEPAPDRVVKAP